MLFRKHATDDTPTGGGSKSEQKAADEYLSRLAQSILKKEKRQQRPPAPPVPDSPTPVPASSDSNRKPRPGSGSSSHILKTFKPPTAAEEKKRIQGTPPPDSHEWIRRVDFYDQAGNLIPGTILLFEDGHVGLFKGRHPVREYDVVYMLKETGDALPEGLPLYNYDVEPIGRLSHACLEQVLKSGRWERDMMVFHLLKYKDHVHIPHVTEPAVPASNERLSKLTVAQLSKDKKNGSDSGEGGSEPVAKGEDKGGAVLTRGRQFSISFGGNQRWQAIYWGRDELGHVVVHQTHGEWSLMHLDLDRFQDSISFNGMADAEALKQIEKQCSTP